MLIWALVSRSCRETVELYPDADAAVADLRAAVADVPEWIAELDVIALRSLDERAAVCLN